MWKKMTRIWNKTSVEKFIDNIREEQFKNIASTIGNDKLIFPWKKKKERKRKEGGWKTELLNARHKGRKYWCAHVLLLRFRPSSTSILRFSFFFHLFVLFPEKTNFASSMVSTVMNSRGLHPWYGKFTRNMARVTRWSSTSGYCTRNPFRE